MEFRLKATAQEYAGSEPIPPLTGAVRCEADCDYPWRVTVSDLPALVDLVRLIRRDNGDGEVIVGVDCSGKPFIEVYNAYRE